MAMSPSEITALMSSGQSLESVANQLQNAGVSLEDVSKASGASVSDLNSILSSGGVSYGGYGAQPAPTPVAPPAAGTQAIAGKTGQMDVLTGQFKYYGTPEYDQWLKGITPELNAYGITPDEYLKGGVGARMMNNPLVAQYSSDFAANNVGKGGGQAWAGAQGGLLGYARNQGYTDTNGYNTGKGDELGGGISKTFQAYRDRNLSNPNYASGNQPGQTTKPGAPTPTQSPTPYRPTQGYQQQPSYQQQPGYSPYGNQRGFSGGYGGYGQQSMYPYQNYGRQGMFGGTATSRQPYTGYQAYQPYGGNSRNGMFGAPTMNYNMRNRPMQQYSTSWSQNNPYSFGGY